MNSKEGRQRSCARATRAPSFPPCDAVSHGVEATWSECAGESRDVFRKYIVCHTSWSQPRGWAATSTQHAAVPRIRRPARFACARPQGEPREQWSLCTRPLEMSHTKRGCPSETHPLAMRTPAPTCSRRSRTHAHAHARPQAFQRSELCARAQATSAATPSSHVTYRQQAIATHLHSPYPPLRTRHGETRDATRPVDPAHARNAPSRDRCPSKRGAGRPVSLREGARRRCASPYNTTRERGRPRVERRMRGHREPARSHRPPSLLLRRRRRRFRASR